VARESPAQSLVWRLVEAAEAASEHPLGQAILQHARDQLHGKRAYPEEKDACDDGACNAPGAGGTNGGLIATAFKSVQGRGLRCKVGGLKVLIGNAALMHDEGISWPKGTDGNRRGAYMDGVAGAWEAEGRTVVLIAVIPLSLLSCPLR
jgi:cation transport ATPase